MTKDKIQECCLALDVIDFIRAHLEALSRLEQADLGNLATPWRMETAARLLGESEYLLFRMVTEGNGSPGNESLSDESSLELEHERKTS